VTKRAQPKKIFDVSFQTQWVSRRSKHRHGALAILVCWSANHQTAAAGEAVANVLQQQAAGSSDGAQKFARCFGIAPYRRAVLTANKADEIADDMMT
jgi:hypothetical protein